MQRAEILDAAKKCVCGQREHDYGNPEDNFKRIADLWNAYMGDGMKFTPKDVAVMMALLKVARIKTGTGTDDCFVDLAGYAACAGEIAAREKEELIITPEFKKAVVDSITKRLQNRGPIMLEQEVKEDGEAD